LTRAAPKRYTSAKPRCADPLQALAARALVRICRQPSALLARAIRLDPTPLTTHSLRSGAARPIASSCGPENAHISKSKVYRPAPGTGRPRWSGRAASPVALLARFHLLVFVYCNQRRVLLCFMNPILGNGYGPGVSSCQQTSLAAHKIGDWTKLEILVQNESFGSIVGARPIAAPRVGERNNEAGKMSA